MNRRNFIQAGAALAFSSSVPAFSLPTSPRIPSLINLAIPLPLETIRHDISIGRLIPIYKHWLTETAEPKKAEDIIQVCHGICADRGLVFISNGKELFKDEYPLLYKYLGNNYGTGFYTFSLPKL